jgi:prepilin-type N-terminal cleavage/methylation domain-containing protein
MKMKKLNKDQKGFTLIEVLIAIAITGLITWGITMTIFQVFDINTRSTNRMAAITQLENAGLWVSKDVQMANDVSTESGLPQLTWNDYWDTGASHAVNYTLENMSSGEFKILQRSHSVNGGEPTETQIAEYIDPNHTSFVEDPEGGGYIFTITATVGGESETRVYKVTPRAG